MPEKHFNASEINVEQQTFSKPCNTKGGAGGVAMIYANPSATSRGDVIFQLTSTTPDSSLVENAVDPAKRQEALSKLPQMHTGYHTMDEQKFPSADGSHRVQLRLTPDLVAVLQRFDDHNIQTICDNAHAWFKRKLDPAVIRAQHNTILQQDAEGQIVARAKLLQTTKVYVQQSDDLSQFDAGEIKDISRDAYVLPIVHHKGMYVRSSDSGGMLVIKEIFVFHSGMDCSNRQVNIMGNITINPAFVANSPEPTHEDADMVVEDEAEAAHSYAASKVNTATMVNGDYATAEPAF